MKRRQFIEASLLTSAGMILSPALLSFGSKKKSHKLIILHTNDTHSNIDPFPSNHSKYPNQGGVARRQTLIKKIRSENENVLLLDAGDIFQGTPYFNKFKGELEMKLMSEMDYDVVTLGNHDFDIGIEGYLKAKKHGTFQVVNANYEITNSELRECVKENHIIKKGRFKIGIFGIGVDLNGLVAEQNWQGVTYHDPIQAAKEQVSYLKKKRCDLIICLSHLGYEYPNDSEKISDLKLAEKTEGIDIIIGGHTHTFLEKNTRVKNKEGKDVVIAQVGYAGLQLGKIEVTLSKNQSFGIEVDRSQIDKSLDTKS
jgi:5'-nucleotidase